MVEGLYAGLLRFGITYDVLYEMTLHELSQMLINRRKGLAYEIWKTAHLIMRGVNDLLSERPTSTFPKTPEEASPELYPPPPSIPIPKELREDTRGKI